LTICGCNVSSGSRTKASSIPARDRFWGGYSGHFQDLNGHLWEIAWNPDFASPV
jgi:uncharacterized glyoxalase superfamily protein PhnB